MGGDYLRKEAIIENRVNAIVSQFPLFCVLIEKSLVGFLSGCRDLSVNLGSGFWDSWFAFSFAHGFGV